MSRRRPVAPASPSHTPVETANTCAQASNVQPWSRTNDQLIGCRRPRASTVPKSPPKPTEKPERQSSAGFIIINRFNTSCDCMGMVGTQSGGGLASPIPLALPKAIMVGPSTRSRRRGYSALSATIGSIARLGAPADTRRASRLSPARPPQRAMVTGSVGRQPEQQSGDLTRCQPGHPECDRHADADADDHEHQAPRGPPAARRRRAARRAPSGRPSRCFSGPPRTRAGRTARRTRARSASPPNRLDSSATSRSCTSAAFISSASVCTRTRASSDRPGDLLPDPRDHRPAFPATRTCSTICPRPGAGLKNVG